MRGLSPPCLRTAWSRCCRTGILAALWLAQDAVVAAAAEDGVSPDGWLLRLLSCQVPAAQMVMPNPPLQQALRRLESLGRLGPGGGRGDKQIDSVLKLEGVCLHKLHFNGVAGVFMVDGELCGPDIPIQLQTLARTGLTLKNGHPDDSLPISMPPGTPLYWTLSKQGWFLLAQGVFDREVVDGFKINPVSVWSFKCATALPADFR